MTMMKSYLGGAAPVQNRGAKPWDRFPGERRQGGAAMRRREEASSFDSAGGPMSRHDGRVSLSQTKPSLLVPRSSWRTSNAVCSPGGTVQPALMPGKWFVSLTDEVPRSSSLRSTTGFYKALPKGSPHAPAAGTATPWPRLQGCLQRQSTPSSLDGGKAKPQSASSASASSRGQLASAKKQSHTPGPPLRTVPPRGEPSGPVDVDFPFLGSALSFTGTARSRVLSGSPGAGNPLAGPVWGIDLIATTGRGWLRPPPYPQARVRASPLPTASIRLRRGTSPGY